MYYQKYNNYRTITIYFTTINIYTKYLFQSFSAYKIYIFKYIFLYIFYYFIYKKIYSKIFSFIL